jgi:hypothetical protein
MKRVHLGPVFTPALVAALREVGRESQEGAAEPVMVPTATMSRDEMEERYPRAVYKAVQEIRDRAMDADKDTPWTFRNRHERRRAAALARRAAR